MPFHIVRDDLANMRVDVVVVPANSALAIGGGAGEAVARIAGRAAMQAACDAIGGCPVGHAVATPAFDFPAKYVVHAVGPVWMGGQSGEADALASCVRESLRLAVETGAATVALPLLATGSFGFPAGEAIDIETRTIQRFLDHHDVDIWLVLFDRDAVRAGRSRFDAIEEYIDDVYVGEHGFDRTINLTVAQWETPEADVGERDVERSTGITGDRRQTREPEVDEHDFGWTTSPTNDRRETPEADVGEHDVERSTGLTGDRWETRELDVGERDALRSIGLAQAQVTGAFAPVPDDAFPAARPQARRFGSLASRLEHLDESFAATVLRLIGERGMTDVEVYKRANISRQLFAKIRKDDGYRPTKKTACALAFALGLNYDDAQALLSRAGFTLSHSSKFDVIVEYFLINDIHDIFQINEALFAYDQPLLG